MADNQHTAHRHVPDSFINEVHRILSQSPEGLGEYELIRTLRDNGYLDFMQGTPALPHELFQAHFLVMHALYVLRDRLHAEQQAILTVSPLHIQLQAWSAGQAALIEHDSLRAYYLDLDNLVVTTEQDVSELIASFWRSLSRSEHRGTALAELGLADPVSDDTIIQTYRKLAMQHHPDRGGDKLRLQAINWAYELLIKAR